MEKAIDKILFEKRNIPINNSFNAVRFVCCLIVIIRHCFDLNNLTFPLLFLLDSHVAVCVFFILSGFWIFKSYLASESVLDFFLKRLRRLYPLYFFTILVYSIVCSFISELSINEYFLSFDLYKYIFWNLLTLNFVHPSLPGVFVTAPFTSAVNGALWTIKLEVAFYLILPVFIFIMKKLKTINKCIFFLGGIYVLSIVYRLVIPYISEFLGIGDSLRHQLPAYICYFVSGMVGYIFWNKIHNIIDILLIPAIFFLIIHYITGFEFVLPITLSIIVFWISIRLTFLYRIGRPVDYSYAMYLCHFPMIQILIEKGFFRYSFVLSVVLIISYSFLFAFGSEKYIQVYFNKQKTI